MPGPAAVTGDVARAFGDSVAGVLARRPPEGRPWTPGAAAPPEPSPPDAVLDDLGWMSLAEDETLVACAGLGGLELGRRLGSIHHVDRLLGAVPSAGGLLRTRGPVALVGPARRRKVNRSQPEPSAEGLDVYRVLEWGEDEPPAEPGRWAVALGAWRAASVGYLAGVGEAALQLTVRYVRGRSAFGATLGALGPVQQLLAGAATAVRGVRLLAAEAPDRDALAHAGPAVAGACAACQQVTGAIGFTLEYPLQRHTQTARALAVWNDALLDVLQPPPAIAG